MESFRIQTNQCMQTFDRVRWKLLFLTCVGLVVAASRNRRIAPFALPAAGSIGILFTAQRLQLSGNEARHKLLSLSLIRGAQPDGGTPIEQWTEKTVSPDFLRDQKVLSWKGCQTWCRDTRTTLNTKEDWDEVDQALADMIATQDTHLSRWQVKHAWLIQLAGGALLGGCVMIGIYAIQNPKSLKLGY